MWNSVILPILTSLAATGLGIFAVWLYNRKRTADRLANEINSIINQTQKINGQMENGFERVALDFERVTLEKDAVLNAFNLAKTETEQANKDIALKQREFHQDIIEKIQKEAVAHEEFRESVKNLITNMENNISKNSDLIDKIVDAFASTVERNINPSQSD